ncbi:hypothetical protein BD847_2763 [Flavobacterium cutihirudinis]|uniref:Lipoprotein n=1 Tax=Flavobacterium cutihirudinis TaxID=1265740 RepID=A0A3D9FT85_9FLAO|nr:hypothetical protein [Flavobacterium cutihirudinis]RED23700.1 hypothetical protein BD847_2763 [Flavobacterium cutihirudinis]
MKKVFILACLLVASGTFVSCTNDDEISDNKSAELTKKVNPVNPSYASEPGPGDDPIKVPPPPVR